MRYWIVLLAVAGCAEAPPAQPLVHTILTDSGAGEVRASTQVVRLRFLDEYRLALERYGLVAADRDVRGAVRAHVRENFAGYDLAVVLDDQPAPVPQTLTVEIRDDNLHHLIAYDNSRPDKDSGNQIKNEYIGGHNAELAAQGLPADGGVFLGRIYEVYGRERHEPRFADAFAPFAPEMGGAPVRELRADDAAANLRVSVLGSLIAASVTLVVGQAVGLPAADGYFHRDGDEGCFMERGESRSFIERAKLDGAREHWCNGDAEYLRQILPSN